MATLGVKDKYTIGHSERVQMYVDMMANELELDPNIRRVLNFAALLHDIGKIEIPHRILNKAERLTKEEFALIKRHPVYSAEMLEPLRHISGLSDIVRFHHERFDGQGYPDGLSGYDIPRGARILSVADSFDAMMSDRPYRKNKTFLESVEELKRCAGSQFDPDLVNVFLKAMENKSKKAV